MDWRREQDTAPRIFQAEMCGYFAVSNPDLLAQIVKKHLTKLGECTVWGIRGDVNPHAPNEIRILINLQKGVIEAEHLVEVKNAISEDHLLEEFDIRLFVSSIL